MMTTLKFLRHNQGKDEVDQYSHCDDAHQNVLQGGVHTIPPFLQAFTAFGKAYENDKRENSHHNDNHIKHAVPPR